MCCGLKRRCWLPGDLQEKGQILRNPLLLIKMIPHSIRGITPPTHTHTHTHIQILPCHHISCQYMHCLSFQYITLPVTHCLLFDSLLTYSRSHIACLLLTIALWMNLKATKSTAKPRWLSRKCKRRKRCVMLVYLLTQVGIPSQYSLQSNIHHPSQICTQSNIKYLTSPFNLTCSTYSPTSPSSTHLPYPVTFIIHPHTTDFETIRDDISDDGQPAAPTPQELLEASLMAYDFSLQMPTEDDTEKIGTAGSRKSNTSGEGTGGSGGHRTGSHGHKRDKNSVRESRSSRGELGHSRSPSGSNHHHHRGSDAGGLHSPAAHSSSHGRINSRHNSNVGTPTASKSRSGATTPTGGRTPREGSLSKHSLNTPPSYTLIIHPSSQNTL